MDVDFWRGRRVLLTGGAGFIGSSCLEEMLRRGAQVVVVDAFDETLYGEAIKRQNLAMAREVGDFVLEEVDLRDAAGLASVFERHAFDAVIHLAARAGVRPSIELASSYYDVNVTGTANLMKSAREAGVTRFALASSSSVYGRNTKTPFAEGDRVESPASPYAASKRSMELMARADHSLHGGHVACLRFFTVYGPRQRPDMAIHKFMRIIDEGERIPMFGDGSTGRDYTYIDDIVAGVLASLERVEGFKIYNLGGDKVVLLSDLIETIAKVVGKPAHIDVLPEQPGDVPLTMADLTLSRAELGYAPATSLPEGVARMWGWYQSKRS